MASVGSLRPTGLRRRLPWALGLVKQATSHSEKFAVQIDPNTRALLRDIMRRFPESGVVMLRYARDRRSIRFNLTGMMEEFARETQRAVSRGKPQIAKQHFDFLATRLRQGNTVDREYIDVYYVEGILHGVSKTVAKDIWALMPDCLRQLYVAMWGNPRLA